MGRQVLFILLGTLFFSNCAQTPVAAPVDPVPAKTESPTSITTEDELRLGNLVYREILKKEVPLPGLVLSKRLEIVGQRIAALAGKPGYDWEFKTFNRDLPHAFVLPGGKVGIYRGLLKYAKNDAGLAAMLSYLMAHQLLGHGKARLLQLPTADGRSLAGAWSGWDEDKKSHVTACWFVYDHPSPFPYTISEEQQALEKALELMAKAGYHPREFLSYWDRMEGAFHHHPALRPYFPDLQEKRRGHIQALLAEAVITYNKASRRFQKGLDF